MIVQQNMMNRPRSRGLFLLTTPLRSAHNGAAEWLRARDGPGMENAGQLPDVRSDAWQSLYTFCAQQGCSVTIERYGEPAQKRATKYDWVIIEELHMREFCSRMCPYTTVYVVSGLLQAQTNGGLPSLQLLEAHR